MSNYADTAESAAFLAGRDSARAMRGEGVGWDADDGHKMCPRGLHPELERAWLRGWRSVFE